MKCAKVLTFLLLYPALCANAYGQDAAPAEMLSRTLFIKAANEEGTAFTIDYERKLYLVTARHVVA